MTLLMTLLYAREIKSISTIIMSDSAIGRFSPRFVLFKDAVFVKDWFLLGLKFCGTEI